MSGEKIQKAKEAAILAVHRLKSTDIVSVVLYDSDVQVLVPATKLTKKEQIIRQIRTVNAGGSTALYAGVQNGADEVRKFIAANKVNRIVLLSDGLANVGPQSPNELGRLGANLVEEGISVTTIGLGLGYNEDLMSQLAYKSDGGHYFAEHADELAGVFDDEFGRATSVVAQDVTIEIICGEG
ncbi:MAG: vWA domain-containing protein, partial [Planctomycetota bacterium]